MVKKSTKTWAKFPKTLAPQYYKEIKQITQRLRRIYNELIVPELDYLLSVQLVEIPEDQRSMDASISDTVNSLFKKMREKFYWQEYNVNQDPKTVKFRRALELTVLGVAKKISSFHKSRFGSNANSMAGESLRFEPWLKDALNNWTAYNVSLISDIPRSSMDKIQKQVMESVMRGDSQQYLQDQIGKILSGTEKNVKLIARDQTNKFYGALTEARAKHNGWDFYEWSTANDIRVRSFSNSSGYSDHKRLDGKIFKFSEPPKTVFKGKRAGERHNPQTDVNCRCVPLILFDQEKINSLKKQSDGSYA